jgi:hypothetical protein
VPVEVDASSDPSGVEVSELAKWGGPKVDVDVERLTTYPRTRDERDRFFERPSLAQRMTIAAGGNGSTGLCTLGVGQEGGWECGMKRGRVGLGDWVQGGGVGASGIIVSLPYVVGFERDVLEL